jgi:hypothetical protein
VVVMMATAAGGRWSNGRVIVGGFHNQSLAVE